MNATELMALAFLLAVIGRWEHGEKAIPSGKGIVEIIFALLLVAFLDQGRTQPLARGFAYVFLAAVLLGSKSPIAGLVNANVVPSAGSGGQAGAASGTSSSGQTGGTLNKGGSGKVLKTF